MTFKCINHKNYGKIQLKHHKNYGIYRLGDNNETIYIS